MEQPSGKRRPPYMGESAIWRVDGATKVLGVCGWPVEHSLSPAMHNTAIRHLGLPYVYVPFSVRPEHIGDAVRAMRSLGIVGLNLTIPHKESVLEHLDYVCPDAVALGAVNTVHCVEGSLRGYCTDPAGFAAPLDRIGFVARGQRALVLGAGGAARSVVHWLVRSGARVRVANRTLARAEALVGAVSSSTPGADVEVAEWGTEAALSCAVGQSDLIVNTTSVGMAPQADEMPAIPTEALHPRQVVYDLIYRPQETRLLAAARSAGAVAVNGVGMLVGQGAEAFRIWTGIDPPQELMEQAVLRRLAGD